MVIWLNSSPPSNVHVVYVWPQNPDFHYNRQLKFTRYFSARAAKFESLNSTKMFIGFTMIICVSYRLLLFSRIRFKPTLRRKYCWSKRPIPLNEVLHYCVRWLSNENQGKRRVCIERRCFRQNSLKCE